MESKLGRIKEFVLKEKTRDIFAFVAFAFFLISLFDLESLGIIGVVVQILLEIVLFAVASIYLNEWLEKDRQTNAEQKKAKKVKDLKLLLKEFIMFLPIWTITMIISETLCQGQSANQAYLEEIFFKDPIYYTIQFIIIGPIVEEFIFRFLPYRFIKNKTLYVIISSVIFAAMHVVNDPNGLYYIWFYMMRPFYYGYRYHKTHDLRVPFFMHSFNNLIATLTMILSCF